MPEEGQNKGSTRRLPQQVRSQQRMNKILDAAGIEFAEVGYEAATTNAIAARAKTSIGSLYRFFPDKTAIFNALASRYIEQMGEVFNTVFTPELQLPITEVNNRIIDAFDNFFTSTPGFRAIFFQYQLSPEILAMDKRLADEIAQKFVPFYKQRNPQLEQQQCEIIALVVVEAVAALQNLSLSRDEVFQKQVVTETKKLMSGYLQPYFPDDES